MEIIRLNHNDPRITSALTLAYNVFTSSGIAHSDEGKESFRKFVFGEMLKCKLNDGTAVIYAAEDNGSIIGMIALIDKTHICLAFVDADFQKRGVGTTLLERLKTDYPDTCFTVNASESGYGFYTRCGFVPTDISHIEDGIIFTPMMMC